MTDADKRTDYFRRWVTELINRRGYWRAAIANAAKNARLCWTSLHYGEDFRLRPSLRTKFLYFQCLTAIGHSDLLLSSAGRSPWPLPLSLSVTSITLAWSLHCANAGYTHIKLKKCLLSPTDEQSGLSEWAHRALS
ncbi:hypothetical protein D6R50_21025 [Aeromonas veronii]|uniref:Uncharacterized protein n=1 Tax=Aeromonas veronii TaxID=654 RepID=A0A3A9I8V3_AERVE|nr:hypothetical protein D6R50_21025 [Aeromonas veronii]